MHDGIAQMFQVIENARMMVGTKAIATLSTGYLNALDYAKSRVQGADLTRATDRTAPRVTDHPAPRRPPLADDAEGVRRRGCARWCSTPRAGRTGSRSAAARGERDELAERVNDLLLPIVKGYGSERSWVLLGTESLQTFGGSGFLQDYPLEQYVRDAKIDTLYEGTTAIQGQDLFFRKIVRDQGQALGHLSGEIQAFVDVRGRQRPAKVERGLLAQALTDVQAHRRRDGRPAGRVRPARRGRRPRNVYRVGLNTTRLLMRARRRRRARWLLLRQAEVALRRLDEGPALPTPRSTQGKVAAASFFATPCSPGCPPSGRSPRRPTSP